MSQHSVFITGCSSGIGRALALEFQRQGYQVFASARRLESLQELQALGIHTFSLDVNEPQQIQQAVAYIQQHTQQLNCLVNNAGFGAMGPSIEFSSTALEQQFRTNVFAPLALAQACLPLLTAAAQAQQPAQLVNIGSVSGLVTTPFSGVYCATKAALHSLSDALRMELKPFGIEVITIQPGAIQSQFGNSALASLAQHLGEQSLYSDMRAGMEARAMASQNNPTRAEDFAATLVRKIHASPAAEIRIGNGSRSLPWLKRVLPTAWLDRILMKKFGLHGAQKH